MPALTTSDASSIIPNVRYTQSPVGSYCMRNPGAIETLPFQSHIADKQALRKLVAEQNAILNIVVDPKATPEKVRAMMTGLGIRAEDNLFSCGIIAARDEN